MYDILKKIGVGNVLIFLMTLIALFVIWYLPNSPCPDGKVYLHHGHCVNK